MEYDPHTYVRRGNYKLATWAFGVKQVGWVVKNMIYKHICYVSAPFIWTIVLQLTL